jgi:hypothetical protein
LPAAHPAAQLPCRPCIPVLGGRRGGAVRSWPTSTFAAATTELCACRPCRRRVGVWGLCQP